MKLNRWAADRLRCKYKKQLPARITESLVSISPGQWTFMYDGLACGKAFRTFNMVDDFNREVLNITIDTSLSNKRVIRELNQFTDWRGKPEKIRGDN